MKMDILAEGGGLTPEGGGGLTSCHLRPQRQLTPQGVGPHPRRLHRTRGRHSEARGVPHLPPPWGYCLAHISTLPGFVTFIVWQLHISR